METIDFEEIKRRLFALVEPPIQPISSRSSLLEVQEWLAGNGVEFDPDSKRKDLIAMYREVSTAKGIAPNVTPIEARSELGAKITRLKTDNRRLPRLNVWRVLELAQEAGLIADYSITGTMTRTFDQDERIKVKCPDGVVASAIVLTVHAHYLYTVKVNHPTLGATTLVIGRDKIIK